VGLVWNIQTSGEFNQIESVHDPILSYIIPLINAGVPVFELHFSNCNVPASAYTERV
jgi:hypothetical protein